MTQETLQSMIKEVEAVLEKYGVNHNDTRCWCMSRVYSNGTWGMEIHGLPFPKASTSRSK